MRTSFSILLVIAAITMAFTQTKHRSIKPAELVLAAKTGGESFENAQLFQVAEKKSFTQDFLKGKVKDYQVLNLDEENLQQLLAEKPEHLALNIPSLNKKELQIELIQVNIFADNFTVIESSTNAPAKVDRGLHYRGVILGEPNSVVSFSFFENGAMGLMSTEHGNMVLGEVEEKSLEGEYILYMDQDLSDNHEFLCGTEDNLEGYTANELEDNLEFRGPGDCVGIYFEVDYDIYLNKGGTTPVVNYVNGLFNEVATLYANENLSLIISEIYVWNNQSPYNGSSSSQMLSQFQNYRTSFNGDLAQLLSYKASGGIAILNGLCHPYTYARMSFSSIGSSYNTVPTYSWSVMVVAHELGHLLGSSHTHACVWNGNNTAIDGCAGFTEGNCSNPGVPSGGGTIMSYCHLTSAGINFTKGFGNQPGNVIRNRVDQASCTQACPGGGGGGGNGGGGNGGTDDCEDNLLILTLIIDDYGPETSWELTNSAGNIVGEGSDYPKASAGTIFKDTFCLADGCYEFVIYDEYGDGICCEYGQGSYSLEDADGNIIASGGEFDSEESADFCLPFTDGGGGGDSDCVFIDNFNDYDIIPYGGAQDVGTYQIQAGGSVLKIQGNAWKAIMMDYTITSNTVLEFEFGSNSQGEIHGIGFDDNNSISYGLTFKVHGTQTWGISNYDNYPNNGAWVTYTIPVGQFYTGDADRLFFVADHDVYNSTANSYFRNVKIYEGSQCDNLEPDPDDAQSMQLEGESETNFKLYPNPAHNQLNLIYDGMDEGSATARIFNTTGQMVKERRWDTLAGENAQQISISDLPQGTYLLKLESDGQQVSERFTIVRN